MNKFRPFLIVPALATAFALSGTVEAQGALDWFPVCTADPDTDPVSDDFSVQFIRNPLFGASLGVRGTVHYDFCVREGDYEAAGRIGFGYGNIGSVHSSLDDGLNLTFGWPIGGSGRSGYATIQEDNDSTFFGANDWNTVFTGSSDTYFFARTVNNNVQVDLRIDLVGDAARLDFNLINIDTVPHRVGLRFGQTVALKTQVPTAPTPGAGVEAYITAPGRRQLRLEERFTRATDPANFPSEVNIGFSQADAYGLKITNDQTTRTFDPSDPFNGQTEADGFVLGQAFFLLGHPNTGNVDQFPDVIFFEPKSDVVFADSIGYIQTWAPRTVGPASSRRIISYYSATHTDAVYRRPYSVVIDAPRVLNLEAGSATQFRNNPFIYRVWVDNNRGFSTTERELPLQDVRVELTLPSGMTAIGGNVRSISRIEARSMDFVDFQIRVDDTVAGTQTIGTRVSSTPGPVTNMTSTINVVSQPRLTLNRGANLVSAPWGFDDPTWETILGLAPDADYTAFNWDAQQRAYTVSTNATRGIGSWIIARNDSYQLTLGGNPRFIQDYQPNPNSSGGPPLLVLRPGWNLIGNPYPVAIQIGQITGSIDANPTSSFSFNELVNVGAISGSLAYWDSFRQTYDFVQGASGRLEPQRGYWAFVFSGQNVVLRFPPVFEPFVRSENKTAWQQSDKQWKLQLAARGNAGADEANFIGVTTTADSSKQLRVYEPPIAPIKSAISLAVSQDINGVASRLSQALTEKAGNKEFRVTVDAQEDGPVTLTWPNLSTIPKNVRVKLVDLLTNESRDLRKLSGYTFQAQQGTTREFKFTIEQGGVSRPVIGAVVSTRTGRASGGDSAIRLTYSLSVDATTTVRILSPQGREVMTLARGRADRAGQNEIVWNLRDQANRAVAPGAYNAEIIVEGTDGERIRKIAPIVVVR